jgi:carboxyl-terminal processing protease
MENRLAEQEERKVARLDRENSRRDARGLEPLDSLDNVESDEVPDVLLNQAAEILTDFASMDDVDRSTILSHADTG